MAGTNCGRPRSAAPRAFFERTDIPGNCSLLSGLRGLRAAKPRGRFWAGGPGSDGVRQAGDRRSARRRTGSNPRRKDRISGATRRRGATGNFARGAARRSGARTGNGCAGARTRGAGIPVCDFREIAEKNSARSMRILNVTQTYFPFLEFGGPPVKVRSLAQQLVKLGHQVTVLTPDWGLQVRASAGEAESGAERTALGWRLEESGIEAIYLPSWLRYRALSWNPGIAGFCRARLWNFDVVHIFGLYDFLGPAVAAACRRSATPYVVEPIGMFVPIVRNFLLKRMYHLALGQRMLRDSRTIIATSPQEVAELTSSGLPPEKIVVRRNGVEIPKRLPERGKFRAAAGISEDA